MTLPVHLSSKALERVRAGRVFVEQLTDDLGVVGVDVDTGVPTAVRHPFGASHKAGEEPAERVAALALTLKSVLDAARDLLAL